ncbi:MAG: TatD family hydrolase [Candidatus Peribacteraceae bacterium]|nr:TatD family hydrolase [Candidatus Peribacteraceae bacterium]
MIDTHCHLADRKFSADLPQVIARAEAQGITQMVTIADSLIEAQACILLSEEYPQVFCAVGVHPHHAKDWRKDDTARLRALSASSQKVRAIGEIGLDYHYDFSPRDVQREVFLAQLALAKELSLPAVVHCREAIEDLRAIIQEVQPQKLVLHCCTERWEDVQPLVENGYLLGFTGIVTYANAQEIRRTATLCPLSQMLLETDAPYLAPVPHRGKRNEPAFVRDVAAFIAELLGMPLKELDRKTTENAVAFFGLSS